MTEGSSPRFAWDNRPYGELTKIEAARIAAKIAAEPMLSSDDVRVKEMLEPGSTDGYVQPIGEDGDGGE